MEAKTFREAFTVLQGNAQTLRDQNEPNIDDLLSIVTESVAAYKVCKARIDAVEKALQEALTDVAASSEDDDPARPAAAPRRAKAAAKPKPAPQADERDDLDNDVPF